MENEKRIKVWKTRTLMATFIFMTHNWYV